MSSRIATALALALAVGWLGAAAQAAPPGRVVDTVTRAPSPARGLQMRISLGAEDGDGAFGLRPEIHDAPLPPKAAAPAPLDLTNLVDFELRPAPLAAPADPGERQGHGDLVLQLPIGAALSLRTGVRVEYTDRPGARGFEAEAVPTLGLGLEF